MNEIDPVRDAQDARRYVLLQMAEQEMAQFEERFFRDDSLFAEVCDAENWLIDAYVAGVLEDADRKALERSFARVPARNDKLKNAEALKVFIEDERAESQEAVIAPQGAGFFRRFSQSLRIPTFGLTAAMLVVMLTLFAVFISLKRSPIESEVASIKSEAPDFPAELERSRDEISSSRKGSEGVASQGAATPQPETPREAERRRLAIVTAPDATSTSPEEADSLPAPPSEMEEEANNGTEPVIIKFTLSAADADVRRVDLKVNGRIVARGLEVEASDKEPSVTVRIKKDDLSSGSNNLVILSESGKQLAQKTFIKD